jgi:hypothetical protein
VQAGHRRQPEEILPPVGPAICSRLPPNSETTTLATIAV